MTSENRNSGTLNFEVDAALLFQLGEYLVARSSIALGELIKNAYDADATQVDVLLQNVSKENGTIIIQDNGFGMTFEDVREHWMRIATDDKIRNPISPRFGRKKTGAKGVGRFAARRLADKLSLHAVARRGDGTTEQVTVRFDWKETFEPGQSLTDIPVAYERKVVSNDTPTGVILVLEDVKDIWTEDDVVELHRDLLTLVSPFPSERFYETGEGQDFEPDPGFSINLEAPEFAEYEGELREHFLEAAWGVLSGWVDESGVAHYHLDIRETGESLDYTEREQSLTSLIGTDFRIYYFVYRSVYFEDVGFGVRDSIRFGREHGGVRIYLDGFRVYKYAERGDDWLQLNELRAERRRHPWDLTPFLSLEAGRLPKEPFLLTPGNNQLFGAVSLSQSHHRSQDDAKVAIQLNVGRDRLVENEAFDQLRIFLRTGIFWMTIQYARVLYSQRVSEPEEEPTLEPITPDVESALGSIERVVSSASELTTQQKGAISRAIARTREITERRDAEAARFKERHIDEIAMLQVLASVGTMISFLDHQLRAIVDNLGGIAGVFGLYSDRVDPQARPVYSKTVENLWRWHRFVKQQVELLGFVMGLRARTELQPCNLRKVVDNVAKSLAGYRMEFGIDFDNQIPENLMSPPMYLAELHAIIINIFTNALKALSNQPRREIMATGWYQGNEVYIQMLDTGKGLDISPEQAFEPFVTTSMPDPVLGEGTGLGLYVVRSLLQTYGGKARFVEAPSPWQTCIEIVLPKGGAR